MTESSISMIVCAGVQVIGRPMVPVFDIQLALHCQARKRLCFLFLFFFLATSFSLFSCPRVLHVLSCASSVGRRLAADDELGESSLSQAHALALLLCICSVCTCSPYGEQFRTSDSIPCRYSAPRGQTGACPPDGPRFSVTPQAQQQMSLVQKDDQCWFQRSSYVCIFFFPEY